MASHRRRSRIFYIIAAVILFLAFFSLTLAGTRRAPWYEEAAWNIITPPQMFFSYVGDETSSIWNHYFYLVNISRENDKLKSRISYLKGKLIKAEEVKKENKRLKEFLGYREAFPQKMVLAKVIANDPRSEFKSIVIDRGMDDGLKSMMPVVGPNGLIGKIGKIGRHTSRVLLIIDPNSAVDVMDQRSRARCLVIGDAVHSQLRPAAYLSRLEYMRRISDVQDGDIIVTSGLDRIFPSGIPVGTVENISRSQKGIFLDAVVVPFENMAELQEVQVVLNGKNVSTMKQSKTPKG